MITTPPRDEPMDAFFAVFNGHINDAHKRTQRLMNKHFGPRTWQKHMAKYQKRGIMSIFEEPPNEYTKFYSVWVMAFVNGVTVL